MSITIYGCSDDLIEVEGDVSEEFSPRMRDEDSEVFIACSDGSVFRVRYDGCWRFAQVTKGTATVSKVEADEMDRSGSRPDGKPWYSDIVTLDGDIKWVIYGDAIATKKSLRSAR